MGGGWGGSGWGGGNRSRLPRAAPRSSGGAAPLPPLPQGSAGAPQVPVRPPPGPGSLWSRCPPLWSRYELRARPLPGAPPVSQQGGGGGHREGAAGGLPLRAAAADRDLGTRLCRGRHQAGAKLGEQEKICQWINRTSPGRLLAFPLPSLPRKQPTVLVVCGPAQNGAIGLVCARHLRIFDYEPTIFYPKRSPDPLYRDFTTQCEKMDIPFLSYLPTEVQLINDAYNAVVDAVLGAEAELGEGRGPCAGILATLKHVRIPIVSLDVPSGWDVEAGSSSGISPDVLVSLMAPKQCARRFLGRQHFVAGRFVPYDVQKKFELNPPEYPGTECVVPL
ncbi:yjeF N-terminal domain-containing protein 3 isoform X1 [Anas platyrhynchos]|uniref:yjeF N-terminal domain-containing protein 3 isoform X1 n=1 Tax=Anas platyrhynchos TaxID=8839 RepID=UPI003AF2CDD5